MYDLYAERMCAICLNQIKNEDIAKELVQDIFKSLWDRREMIKISAPIENYLYRSAKLKVIDHFRAEERARKYIECSFNDYCNSGHCTENHVLYNELAEKVNFLVDSLPCQCRNVYKLSREKGLSNKEIASSLLISERAVEFHITNCWSSFQLSALPVCRKHEALGDGKYTLVSPGLKPEQSLNFNMGLGIGKFRFREHSLGFRSGIFYRDTKDLILYTPENRFGRYRNINSTLGKGVEAELSYQFKRLVEFNANITYMDIRNNEKLDYLTKMPNIVYGDRLRNTPYLMSNAGLRINILNSVQKSSRIFTYGQIVYVHEFYRWWPSLGETGQKSVIPSQWVFDAGIGYTFPKKNFSVAFDVSNPLQHTVI